MPRIRSFTLVELIIVVVILGILLSVGLMYYTNVREKGRSAEARALLGVIRTAEEAYRIEEDSYASVANGAELVALGLEGIPTDSCLGTHYFRYTVAVAGNTYTATAQRCTADGKSPDASAGYSITLDQDGTLTLPVGF